MVIRHYYEVVKTRKDLLNPSLKTLMLILHCNKVQKESGAFRTTFYVHESSYHPTQPYLC